jgi:Rieske Fe-S protein
MSQTDLPSLDPGKGVWDEKELNRRQFLEITFWAVTGVVTLGVAGVGARFVAGDSLDPTSSNWVQVGSLTDLDASAVNRVNYTLKAKDAWREVEQTGVLYAYSVDGTTYTVLDASCPHLGCVVQWQPDTNTYVCPCHSGVFTREGAVISGPPPRPMRRLETKVEDGILWAQI